MEILSTTITARATSNYQVGEVSVEITNYTEPEFQQVQQYTIERACGICLELQKRMGVNPETPKVEVNNTPRRSYMTQNNPVRSTMTNDGIASGNRVNPPSQKQIEYLQSLGYRGQIPATSGEVYTLINQLKSK